MQENLFTTTIGGKKVEVKTGKYCGQSNGSCFIRCQDTVVMVNATMSKSVRAGQDFFPLGVDYEEKLYSVGKIPGGWKRREGRPADSAILRSRLIDRPLRPLFPKGFYNDVEIVATPLSVDPDVKPEPLAMLGSSIALSISDIPFDGPTGAVNVGYVDGKFVINPTEEQAKNSILDLTVSGTKEAILMVEAGANQVSEELMLDAIMFAHDEIKKQVEFVESIQTSIGKEKNQNIKFDEIPSELDKEVREFASEKFDEVLKEFDRHIRDKKEEELTSLVMEKFIPLYEGQEKAISQILYNMKKEKVRHKIIFDGIRPDGRKLDEIRPIWCEVGLLPRVHGSAVFTRGETQVLTTLTLGMLEEAQELEGLDNITEKRYMHHYNMPGYTTGEAKPLRTPGRREIGHGALAERALLPVLPNEDEFPYAIRTVSEVLSSNGSTSQASVCGSTLALMDGGVPISSPVAGIAMGLIKDKETGKVAVLTDIQGLEDFLGDMDFKVAGTEKGITAIQMDMKIHGIDRDILKVALEKARIGRLKIMNIMLDTISAPRENISKYAPKIITFKINPDKIKDVIGSNGKMINQIIAETNVKIEIEDEGDVYISSTDEAMLEKAKEIILKIVEEIVVGNEYIGEITKISNFGAFMEIGYKKEGMIHISKLSDKRIDKVEDMVNVGDKIRAKVIKVDDKGRIDLKLVEIIEKKS